MKIETLEKELSTIYKAIVNREFVGSAIGEYVHPHNKMSVMNMLRYITLRSHDLRKVHDSLSERGVTSLRSAESYVYRNVTDALKLVNLLQGKEWQPKESIESLGYKKSKKLLSYNANQLFNKKEKKHSTEIMVTLPESAYADEDILKDLLRSGMEIARIDLHKGDIHEWLEVIKKLRNYSLELKAPCKILADLPKNELKIEDFRVIKKSMKLRQYISVQNGDHIKLSTQCTQATDCVYGLNKELITPATLPLSQIDINAIANVGDQIILSKGNIKGIILSKTEWDMKVLIKQTHKKKSKIFADSHVSIPNRLIEEQEYKINTKLINAIKDAVDMIGISGLQSHKNIISFFDESQLLANEEVGLVVHIDSQRSWSDLPLIMIEAMRHKKIGIMVDRENIAMDVGADRAVEIKDQILWLCEAAHVPVIWSTNILENLTKSGIAKPAEITDAAKAARTECVMLSDGPFIIDAVNMLSNILVKMEQHSYKKKNLMRTLSIATSAQDAIDKKHW